MALGMKVGLGPGHIVLDGDPAPPPKKAAEALNFRAKNFYSGQTAGCIKMPLGMAVGIGPGHIVLDGIQPPPPEKRGTPPFSADVYIVAKRLYASGYHLVRRHALA